MFMTVILLLALIIAAGAVTQTLRKSIVIGGVDFSEASTHAADVQIPVSTSVGVAKQGTLTTRTDANTGTITMDSGSHGIVTGQRVDLYWSGGHRRGMTVGTVSGTSVPIDLGAGTDLPATSTVIRVATPTKKTMMFDGDDIVFLAVQGIGAEAIIVFADVSDAELKAYHVISGDVPTWDLSDSDGIANPLAGASVVSVFLSHGDTASSRVIQAGIMY